MLAFGVAALLLWGCSPHMEAPSAGVPHSLAEARSSQIGKVSYALSFDIPADQGEPVSCHDSLTFELYEQQTVWLDFQGDSLLPMAKVNGHKVHLKVEDEHIRIPEKFLSKGGNSVVLDVICSDVALNRREDYLYTLFVPDHARSAFPCFDQPDIKAKFDLTLCAPEDWLAISDGTDMRVRKAEEEGRSLFSFASTDLIPTYLFSFAAGRFEERTAIVDGRTIRALYREIDPKKVAQLDTIFSEIGLSLRWLERYTGISYPFQKYGLVILPGYQFGGMEHPGAIQYNDKRLFLGDDPTPQEELARLELIAHETTHMWFGDLVTMRWFDDVWTKEVFANYLASKISGEKFPDIDHDLDFLRAYQTLAMDVDRTEGTHPILQPLDNLDQAGLLYGNIIYDKSPVMLRKLERLVGEDAFRSALRSYLQKYSYANATWGELVSCFAEAAPDKDVQGFSRSWVEERGMPTITWTVDGERLTITQSDPFGAGTRWSQTFLMGVKYGKEVFPETVSLDGDSCTVLLPSGIVPDEIVPNMDGSGYGWFRLSGGQKEALDLLGAMPEAGLSPAGEYGLYVTIFENYLHDKYSTEVLFPVFMERLMKTENPLLASYIASCAERFAMDSEGEVVAWMEAELEKALKTHPAPSVRQQITRWICSNAVSPAVLEDVHTSWQYRNLPFFGERDYMSMAYHLAVMMPSRSESILREQRARLTSDDRRAEFDFISRACVADTSSLDTLAASLSLPENRAQEAWTLEVLALLNDPSREPHNNAYILPALRELPAIQSSSSIFFPGGWCSSLLRGHRSEEAAAIVRHYLEEDAASDRPLSPPLRNKLLQAAYMLLR